MQVSVYDVASQRKALEKLGELIERGTIDPLVRNAALAITADCDSRDDECEVRAIFEAVKTGSDRVKGLENGFKYVSDPRWADFFTSPQRILQQLANGINGGDCDDHCSLICGLLGSLGFVVGLRAWGQAKGEFEHVYAVVGLPKIDPDSLVGLDTTVDESEPGWEPPIKGGRNNSVNGFGARGGGFILTALLDGR